MHHQKNIIMDMAWVYYMWLTVLFVTGGVEFQETFLNANRIITDHNVQ